MFGEAKTIKILVRNSCKSVIKYLGGEANVGIQNLRELIPGNNKVKDVGLGFMHTLVVTEA